MNDKNRTFEYQFYWRKMIPLLQWKHGLILLVILTNGWIAARGQVIASFTTPDTVCLNSTVSVANNSVGASTYYWNFCTANINNPPQGTNLGNPGSQLTTPCFIDYAFQNGNYYGFITSNNPASLVRLDFGNSLLNAPTATNLGNFGDIIPFGAQGIQIVNSNGQWHAIIVGGDPAAGGSSRILKIDFGTSLANNSPVATNWGNIGGLQYPHDLYVFQDGANWYGFTVNYLDGSATRFSFGTNFSAPPVGTNLGSIGGMNKPSGICPVNDNGTWRVFVANFGNNTMTRLDFGNSLLNPPTGAVNLGTLGGKLNSPRDIYIFNYCSETVGFVVNDNSHEVVRINFNSLTTTPAATSLGNIGGIANPHSISKLFRVNSELFAFVPNSYVNTITRLRFNGCTSASSSASTSANPPAITYNSPGTFNINLTVDEGLTTQTSFCKKVVVLAPPTITPTVDQVMCPNSGVPLNPVVTGAVTYSWSPAAGLSNPAIRNPIATPSVTTEYILSATNAQGCTTKDTVSVTVLSAAQCNSNIVVPSFTAPDTVCVNSPVTLTNTSTGASNYFWNFCVADVNTPPVALNLGNPGNSLAQPVFVDVVQENGNFYGFVVNHFPGGLVRLDFGNDMLNIPTAVNLGNPGNILNSGYGSEGIQVVKSNGKWYAVIVGGNVVSGGTPRIGTVSFGASITNTSPSGTNWGNIGALNQPIDFHMFQENANWYGFAVNAVSNTITRFNFGINLDLAPTATNLGNIGNLDYPDGVFAINDNGFWRVFVTNGNAPGGSLTRLDFGNSLLNNPTGTNLGSLGNKLVTPRDITLLRYCGETIGFVVNGSTNQIVKLNFASLTSTPTATNIGNLGNLDFPHSLSKLFRAGNDIYSFITNVNNNTLTRLKFTGCTSSSLPSSNLQTPAPVSYSAPGTYNINLTVDDGLATQSSFCKKVVVISPPSHYPTQNFLLCPGEAIRVGSQTAGVNYVWNTGATTDSITIITGGTYWVESSRFGCSSRDSFVVTQAGAAALDFTYQQNPCTPGSVQFSSILPPGIPYYWDFGNGITNTTSLNPSVLFSTYGTYTIKLRTNFSGSCKDSIVRSIVIDSLFGASLLNNIDTTICLGDSVRLRMASIGNFCWQSPGIPSNGVSSFVKPAGQTTYKLIGEELGLNLIINGDFSNGNTGFTSEYASASSGVAPDTYFVGTSPAVWNPGFSQCGDHTTSNGNMLMINGGIATSKVWYQTITVAPNTNYSFSGWIQSLTSSNPANLRFAINNVDGGNLIQAPTSACQWQKFTVKWNSGNNTSAAVAIISDNSGSGGNDFALDDLSIATFRIRYDSFTVNVTGLCDTIKISGSEKICSPNEVVNYSIYRPVNCSQSFTVNVDNSFADVISQDATSVKLKYKKDGQTTVYVSFNNACKVVIDSLPVRIRFSPTMINFGPDLLVCRDTSFTLHAGPEFESYLWNDGSTDSVRSVFSTGIFSVRAQNLCGLVLRDTIILTKQGIVPFSALPATVSACLNDSVRVSAAGGALYSWTPVASFAQPASPSTRAVVISNQSLTVAIRDTVCRRDTVIVIPVSVFATNPLVVTKTNDVDCSNDSSSLRALGSSQYTWSSSALAQPATTSHITVRPSRTTTFTVAAVDQNGCKSTDSVTVIFSKTNEQRLFVPNAFTPNGDGLNDVFRPVFTGPYKTFNIRIYNRWGQLLFQSGDPLKGWNGKFNNRDQPKDVYVYYLLADGECNGNFKQKGSFVLIR